MKKFGKLLVVSLLTLTLLVACGGGQKGGATVNMGVASTQEVSISEKDGSAGFETVVVGVALKDDKVVYVNIDQSQQKATLEDGKAVMEARKTKKLLGADYGMLEASKQAGLGKEWFEQIEALEEALVGLTKDEVKAYFTGEEVKTASTMNLDQISETVLKALDQTVEVKGAAKVGLGYEVSVSVGKGEDAPQSVLDYAMIAVDADGKIVKALLDNAQEKAAVEGDALVAKNIGATKGELKEKYAMLEASPIKKEWNEQNDALMVALEGKTIDEALSLEPGKDDLETTVTIHLDSALAAVKHAESNLKEVK